jgi:NDP-mannose synthase
MHAVLLAGGKGTRLGPFTATMPKVLLPVDGVPVIERIIDQLRQQGIHDCTVVIGHLAEMVTAHLGSGERLGVRIRYVREARPLDTAGCLGQLSPREPFLLINSDILTDFQFIDLARSHQRARCAATVAVCRHSMYVDFGVVQCDAEGRMSGYFEKPSYDVWVSMGVYCLDPSVCRLVDRGERVSMPHLLRRVQDAGHVVRCHQADCYWRDIGRPEDYARANEELEEQSEPIVARYAA